MNRGGVTHRLWGERGFSNIWKALQW